MHHHLRSGALVGLLTVALPAAAVLLSTTAAAQQDAITERAREKFKQGVEAFGRSRFGEARDLFMQAYAIKRHPAVLLNLGLSELKLGEAAEGANHLQQFLREFDKATPQQVKDARDGIAEAKKSAGYVIVIVDTDGAQISLDGQPVGQSPLVDPVFVKPGDHELEARGNGRVARSRIQAKAGSMSSAQLNLRLGTVETSPVEPPKPREQPPEATTTTPPSTAPSPSGTAPSSGGTTWSNDLPPPENGPYMGPGFGPGPSSPPPPEVPTSNRPSILEWLKRKPAAIATLSVGGGLGLIGTIGFGAAAGAAKSAASDVSGQILAEVQSPSDPSGTLPAGYYDASGRPIPCGTVDDPSTAHPYYRDACDLLRENRDAYDVDIGLMATSLAVMTLSVGGTALWYYLDTNTSGTSTPTTARPFITVAPLLGADQRGLGVVGSF